MKTVNILTRFMGTKKRPRLIARQGRQKPNRGKLKLLLILFHYGSFVKRLF